MNDKVDILSVMGSGAKATVPVTSGCISGETMPYLSIEEYLTNKVGFEVTEVALKNICMERDIPYGADATTLSRKQLDLAYADVLMWGATTPSTISGAKDSDGGWSHQDESRTMAITDKRLMRSTAMDIYKKWGDSSYASTMKFITLTGKPYRRG